MSNEYHVHKYCGKNFREYANHLTGMSVFNAIIILQKCLNERIARNDYYLESHRGSQRHSGHEHAKKIVDDLLVKLRAVRAASDYDKDNPIHVTYVADHNGKNGRFILEILYKNSNNGQYLTKAKCKNVSSCSVQGGKKSRKTRKTRKTRKSRK